MQSVRVVIVGGGVAGCTLWLALHRLTQQALARGTGAVFSATVYEQARQIEAVGAGITLGPNGLRVLDSLDVFDKLKVLGGPVTKLHVYRDSGAHLRTFDCSFVSRQHGYPLLCMERAELQALLVHQVLYSSLHSHTSKARPLRFGKKCVLVRDLGPKDGVLVRFEDGSEAVGDVVIGADGAGSAVRSAFSPSSSASPDHASPLASLSQAAAAGPEYAGISCVLGVTNSVPSVQKGNAYWVLGPGRIYGSWSMGRHKQYWFLAKKEGLSGLEKGGGGGVSRVKETGGDGAVAGAAGAGEWTPADALQGMDEMWNWFHPYDAHDVFSRTIRTVKVGFYELPSQAPFVGGLGLAGLASDGGASGAAAGSGVKQVGPRVAVMGDAAHAMLPTVHQGASLAIEDAAVLAHCLGTRFAGPGGELKPELQEGAGGGEAAAAASAGPHGGGFAGRAAAGPGGGALADRVAAEESSAEESAAAKAAAVAQALQDFSAERSERVRRMVDMSRRVGLWQTSDSPRAATLGSLALQWVPQFMLHRSLDWLYSYKPPSS